MPRKKRVNSFDAIALTVAERLRKRGVKLTLGGEPSYVPVDPSAPEWSITAIGPTKLRYAQALADVLIERVLPGAAAFFSPGKFILVRQIPDGRFISFGDVTARRSGSAERRIRPSSEARKASCVGRCLMT